MERAVCEKCGAKQPVDWAPADLCVACGAAVRREVRCAWCAEWAPGGKFCRSCGCELVDEGFYGAARMLKSAGVDRFSLAQRLRGMDAELRADLTRIYDAQRAIVMRRVDEGRLCEKYLLQRGYADRLEEQLIRLLPMQKEDLDALASGPIGPFGNCPELLPEITQQSPLQTTRILASIALLRLGRFGARDFAAVVAGLQADQLPVAVEAALVIAHWRIRLYACFVVKPLPDWWRGFSFSKFVRVARAVPPNPSLRPWAAAALALASFDAREGTIPEPGTAASAEEQEIADSLRPPLRDGLISSDPDLRFTCAMALGEEGIVASQLQCGDEEKRNVARRFLAKRNSPAIRSFLIGAPSNLQSEILQNLSCPLPPALVEPVLSVVDKGDSETRERAVLLLQPSLTPAIVERLVDLALKEKDLLIFRLLLGAKSLPDRRRVVRAILGAGLLPQLTGSFCEAPSILDFSNEEAFKGGCETDPNTLDALITIALCQVDRGHVNNEAALHIGRFLVRTAFGPHPMNLRLRAYEMLTDYRMQPLLDWLNPSIAGQLFGGLDELVSVIASLLGNTEAPRLSYNVINNLYRCWEQLVPAIGQNPARLNDFVSVLQRFAKNEGFPYLAAHAQALSKIAPHYPKEVFPLLSDLLSDSDLLQRCNEIPVYILNTYEELRAPLSENPSLAWMFAEALIRSLRVGSPMQYPQLIAMDLLEKVLTDFAPYRAQAAEILRPRMEQLDSEPVDVQERLQHLADVVGLRRGTTEPADLPVENVGPESNPLEVLDHEVLLPGEALATLADYVACMKEIGSASNPAEVMARHNLSVEQYGRCVSAWGDLISRRDDVGIRYAQLCAKAWS